MTDAPRRVLIIDDEVSIRFTLKTVLEGAGFVTEAAAGTERQAEEFQLVCGRTRALAQQFETPLAHLRVLFVGEQFDPIVERPHRRQQVMAKARTKEAGEFDRIHSQWNSGSLT